VFNDGLWCQLFRTFGLYTAVLAGWVSGVPFWIASVFNTQQDQCMYKRNTEARSRNHRYRGKAILQILSVCL
jgi:hypothetical protein